MRLLLACLAFTLACAAWAQAPSGTLDAVVSAELFGSGPPGAAYAVIDADQTITGAQGVQRRGGKKPITRETPFLIGSISKSVTAMAVMQLVESGAVDLDAPARDYLDALEGRPIGAATIRQLLSHTSGLSTRQGNGAPGDADGDSLQQRARTIARLTPPHAPGARWQYSNANYILLGALVEAVSGQDYGAYVKTRILDPIGMTASFVSDDEVHPEMAVGHAPWFGVRRPIGDTRTRRATAPAGGIVSTAPDLALYLAVMMNGEDDVISAASKSLMIQPASAASPFYGLGWSLDSTGGTVFHSGLTPGVETFAIFSPADRKGAVILVNANGGMGYGGNQDLFNRVIARALGGPDPGRTTNWGVLSLFLTFAALPVVFVGGMVAAIRNPQGLRAKSGPFGAFSLWFPLAITLALAWTSVWLIPRLFGVSLKSFASYQPDFVLLLAATATTGVLWAVVRLGLFHLHKPS